jgi:septum formation protein
MSLILILASNSPRRRQLLAEAGYVFRVEPADIDESVVPAGLSPAEIAQYLALAKGRVVADRFPQAVVLAADTVVALGNRLLGKPADAADARAMLGLLSGTTQQVCTGVAVFSGASIHQKTVSSTVAMRRLSDQEIDAYVAGGQWQGKAGGYGIQDDDPFVTRMEGSLTNIVGLPMDETRLLLARAGVHPVQNPPMR